MHRLPGQKPIAWPEEIVNIYWIPSEEWTTFSKYRTGLPCAARRSPLIVRSGEKMNGNNRIDHQTAALIQRAIAIDHHHGVAAAWALLARHQIPAATISRVLDGPRRSAHFCHDGHAGAHAATVDRNGNHLSH
jgi:hypothetical protein